MSQSDSKVVRIGCGSGFAMDRIEPALDLARSGRVNYLAFDALAERTLAMAQLRRLADPSAGYDSRLAITVKELAGHVSDGLKVIGSFGAANVEAATDVVVEGFRSSGVTGVRVAAITGDDVLRQVLDANPYIDELGMSVKELGTRVTSANAYLGAHEIKDALDNGADWVHGGRISDPSLYVGAICHDLGWSMDEWDRVAHATLVGHLLECSTHVTGGFYADPPYRIVDRIHELPFPMAEVQDGSAIITKLDGTGGLVNRHIVAAQVSYEVHDPAAYTNADIIADFTQVTTQDVAPNRVLVSGARGSAKPQLLKVLVGIDVGWKVVGEISYAASGCLTRARLAQEILQHKLDALGSEVIDARQDIHGIDTLVGEGFRGVVDRDPLEVRVRLAARCRTREAAEKLSLEVERLYLEGPAGGGGVVRRVEPALGVFPVFLDRDIVPTSINYVET